SRARPRCPSPRAGSRRPPRAPNARTDSSRAALHSWPAPWDGHFFLVIVPVVGLGQHMGAAGLVGPVFPGPPRLRRIRTIAPIAGIDLALAQIFDLAAQLLGAQQRARIARQVD